MKAELSILRPKSFKQVTVMVTFETKKEMEFFVAICNHQALAEAMGAYLGNENAFDNMRDVVDDNGGHSYSDAFYVIQKYIRRR